MPMILVTGANGFIGGGVCRKLAKTRGVRAVVRQGSAKIWPAGLETVQGDVSADFDWSGHLKDVSLIVHCAARVHVLKEESLDPLAEFRAVNVSGTLNLARQAADAGVGRFIFLSSIGVNGLETTSRPFRSGDLASPHSDYARSKFEAEQGLLALAGRMAMDVVIIRPPLVYGPGAPGNFSNLMKWVSRGIPLPLGAVIRNRRSFIYLQNLVDLIEISLDHPAVANQVFLVSDNSDVSTADLVRLIAKSMSRPSRLVPVPVAILRKLAGLLGRSDDADRLLGSLQVDVSETMSTLSWKPPTTMADGIAETVKWYRRSK